MTPTAGAWLRASHLRCPCPLWLFPTHMPARETKGLKGRVWPRGQNIPVFCKDPHQVFVKSP